MSDKLEGNPFAALFSSLKDAEQFTKQQEQNQVNTPSTPQQNNRQNVDSETAFLENLVLFTTRPNHPHAFPRVLLPDASTHLATDSIQFLLFERLLLDAPEGSLVGRGAAQEEDELAGRREVVVYLSEVYGRCFSARDKNLSHIAKQVQEAVITNLATALEQPELYGGQQPDRQLTALLTSGLGREAYIEQLATALLAHNNSRTTLQPFQLALNEAVERLRRCELMNVDYQLVGFMEYYASNVHLASMLIPMPQDPRSGRGYQDTPLGTLLAISCLAKKPGQPPQFFQQPSSQPSHVHKDTEHGIWHAQDNLNARTHKIFYALLKVSSEAKIGLLEWIESCLVANSGRAGVWHIQGGMAAQLSGLSYVCDGFMINLGAIMLLLAQPFTQDHKILKVDPTYCTAPHDSTTGAFTGDLGKQTTLVPQRDDSVPPTPSSSYSFITSCFFLTHRSLHLGVQVVYQRLHKVSQELGRLQQELAQMGGPEAAGEAARTHLETRISILLNLKAALFSPQLMEGLMEFLGASTEWLVQLALCPEEGPCSPLLSAPRELKLPLPSGGHVALQWVPELIVETLTSVLNAVHRHNADLLMGTSATIMLPNVMAFITVFMGEPDRINNPHLRAHLAGTLEALLPSGGRDEARTGVGTRWGILGDTREQLFLSHPLAPHLPNALLSVFVTIEVTGHAVAFEEKFNYRKPMYEVLKFLWSWPQHRKGFVQLAKHALANMEAATPPLFLRFVNLLMNDAIFLLDEGLSFMSQIRDEEIQRDGEEWANLSAQERAERDPSHHRMTLLARFHNLMGAETIHTLIRFTKEIPEMFTHRTLVDRMAAMLNYFLSTLVGPKQRNLKVKDMEKYEFRPGDTVSDICTIYIHLQSHPEFCCAVAADGRSYTPMLFTQAANVLRRISRGALAEEVDAMGLKVAEAGLARADDEDIAADAPDEFLDPIMSQLMIDPVILPSSKLTCDRQTIARHLLSDQTDPFNRQPLTMEQVITNEELKNRIQSWLTEQREKRRKAREEEERKKEEVGRKEEEEKEVNMEEK